MKIKSVLTVLAVICLILLCGGSVSAAQNDANDTQLENNAIDEIEQADEIIGEISVNESVTPANDSATDITPNETANTTQNDTDQTTTANQSNDTASTNTTGKITKIKLDLYNSAKFIQKSNKNLVIQLGKYNEKKNKVDYYKNVKVTVKVKIGSKVKKYDVKTNSKGKATVFNIKNLKTGAYTYTVTSNDNKYKINEKRKIGIYSKNTKSVTVKIDKNKKVKGDIITSFIIKKNSQYKKGVYAQSYNAKKPLEALSHTVIKKVKFFFKNKKTGKTITKTVKSKTTYDKLTKTSLISGYTPIKAQIWYGYR